MRSALAQQVEERGYNPPRRERILEWQEQQDFPICPNPEDPDACNVYNELQFPHDAYQDSRSTARNGKPPTPRFCTLLT